LGLAPGEGITGGWYGSGLGTAASACSSREGLMMMGNCGDIKWMWDSITPIMGCFS